MPEDKLDKIQKTLDLILAELKKITKAQGDEGKYHVDEELYEKAKKLATFLVSACYDDIGADYSLCDFALPKSLSKLEKQGGKVFLIHSKDDKVVSFKDFEKYKKDLPMAETIIFEDRGHFDQLEFPEIVEKIKEV
jgi:pimeloyl-ACP methyl ester carboxylesterase